MVDGVRVVPGMTAAGCFLSGDSGEMPPFFVGDVVSLVTVKICGLGTWPPPYDVVAMIGPVVAQVGIVVAIDVRGLVVIGGKL